jgi:transcription initiation factor IIE alpha subunit
MHWISAISEPGAKNVHVGVPKFIQSSIVGTMSTEALTLLASIARHDSLTSQELLETTGVDKIVIRKCLKEAHDKDLIWSDSEGRIRISSRAQSAIDYYLIGKNFLYE